MAYKMKHKNSAFPFKSPLKMTEEELWTQVRGGKTKEEFGVGTSAGGRERKFPGFNMQENIDNINKMFQNKVEQPEFMKDYGSVFNWGKEKEGDMLEEKIAPKDYGSDDNSTAKKSVDVEVTVNGQKV